MNKNNSTLSSTAQDKVIRANFTLAETEYLLIEESRERLLDNRLSSTKSEIIRAGLIALKRCSNKELLECYNSLVNVRPGRHKQKD
jgi:hypothetical protein